ncbi:MAG TPA: hypothetical protein VN805_03045 [Caulobacteraceae bacterium]|nr:hypothetical protein [Caulobacteraceae bacterium]
MVIAIDSSVLLSYYDLKAGVPQSQTGAGSGSVATTPPTQTTPWATTPTATQTSLLVQRALSGRQLFNPSAVSLSIPPTAPNYGNTKQLFALYQGLTALQDIATQANASGMTAGFQLTQLQTAFASGMQQLETYLNGSPFAGFQVAQGSVAASDQTSAGVPVETDKYTTGVLVSGDPTTPVAALAGNVQFSMTVTLPSGTQTVVNFNLADMGSTPRSLANVINYLNSQLQAAGVFTRFADVLTQGTSTTLKVDGQTITGPPGPNTYALQIVGNPIEKISLSSPTTSPAVYITQQDGASTSNTPTGAPAASGNTTASGPTQQLLKLTTDPSATSSRVFSDTFGPAVQNAVATATAPDGSVYVLANIDGPTQTGQLTASHGISGQQDVALMKYDSAGNLVWTQTLGSTQSASGLGLAVSADGSQIAIVGQGTGLSDNNGGPPTDTTDPTGFVQVYSSAGAAAWSQSVEGWTAGQVSSVAFGADGSLFVAGSTQIGGGPSDEFLAGFSPSGQPTFSTTLGLTSANGIAGIAVDGSSLITAGDQNGQAVVQSYALQPTGAPTLSASETLGQADVAGVAVNSDGSIVVGGSTNNGALDPSATVGSAYTSGENAFAATLNASLTPSSSDTLAYFNGGADTTATAVTAAGGQVYIAGQVAATPSPGSGALTASDGFAAQIDPATGAVTWSNIIDTSDNQSAPNSIAVDPAGASSLDALGLPSGAIAFAPSQDLTVNTGVQPGDQFTIHSNFNSLPTTITIQATDTLQSLAQEIEQATGFAATAQVVTANGVQQLEITPVSSSFQITLGAGPAGQDALPALGLTQGLVTDNATAKAKSAIGVNGARPTTTLKANYGLGLESSLSLNSKLDIANALAQLGGAITTVKQVYSQMTTPPSVGVSGPVPAYLTAEIASYQAALARLTAGS